MEDRRLQFNIGLFVVAAMVILGILIFLNSEGFRSQYTIFVKPQTAPGVTKNTPIRKNGILIGRVGRVKTEDDHVLLSLKIDADEKVHANDVVSIGTDSFLGDAVVEIIPVAAATRGERLGEGGNLSTVTIKRNPLEIVDLAMNLEGKIEETLAAVRRAGDSIDAAGQGVKKLTDQVQEAIGDNNSNFKDMITNFQDTSKKAQAALDNFNKLFEGINDVVGDEEFKNRIRETVKKIPEVFDELKTTIASTRDTINTFREVSASADKNLKNLEPFTDALKENGKDIIAQINKSLQNVDGMMGEIKKFAGSIEKINAGEGTIGKLIHDPTVYNNINGAAENVKRITTQLEPLLKDLRMFGDSIARDPGQLGVRGALNPRTPGTGYKGTTVGGERNQR